MATFAEIMEIVIAPISVLYRAGISADTEQRRYNLMVDEYVNFLKEYDSNILSLAVDNIKETYKQRSWPTPAHILDAIRVIAKEHHPVRVAIESNTSRPDAWAKLILQSEWGGRAAAVEGLLDLQFWAKDHPDEWPTEELIEKFRLAAIRHHEFVSGLSRDSTPGGKAAHAAGVALLGREARLVAQLNQSSAAIGDGAAVRFAYSAAEEVLDKS